MVINIEDIIEQTLNNLAPSEWRSGELKARLDTMQQDFANSLDEKQREMYTNLQNTQAEYDSTHRRNYPFCAKFCPLSLQITLLFYKQLLNS